MTNTLRIDPTRMVTVRRRMIQQMRIRIKELERAVGRELLKASKQAQYHAPESLVQHFYDNINNVTRSLILSQHSIHLWDKCIYHVYEKGIERACTEIIKEKPPEEEDIQQPTNRHTITRLVMMKSSSEDMIRVLVHKARNALAIPAVSFMNRVDNIFLLAVMYDKEVDKQQIQRQIERLRNEIAVVINTEITRAYADGQLALYSYLQEKQVSVIAEWKSGSQGCSKCSSSHGRKIKVKDAKGLIPFHPNCRCCWCVSK